MSEDGTSMTITFENGQTATVNFPDPVHGQDGAVGNGIESIVFDDETGELVITMTNDVVYRFDLVVKDGAVEDSKLVDVDGKYFFKALRIGAFDMANFEYTDDFQIASVTVNSVEDGEVYPEIALKHSFENGKIAYTEALAYATRPNIYYDYRWVYFNSDFLYSEVTFTESMIQYSSNEDAVVVVDINNSRNYYKVYYLNGIPYSDAVVSAPSSENHGYSYSVKKSPTDVWNYYYLLTIGDLDYYLLETKYLDIRTIEKGDILEADYLYREYDGDNVSKVYSSDDKGGEYNEYIKMSYTGSNISKIEEYTKQNGSFVKSNGDLSFNYDANDKLESVLSNEGGVESDSILRVVYDANLNPVEIWAYQEASFEYSGSYDEITGEISYGYNMVREAGFRKVIMMEYYDDMKNFFGPTINAIIPELDNLELTRAPKRAFILDDNSSIKFEYKEFNKGGYPEAVQLMLSEEGDGYVLYEALMDYKVKK
ncbi:hypothetical protein [Flammeovirga aprica]|uniref:Uncharacterized protein n=1 Tax=Flammeovirga aprica JL-4 TaxID=694437 RepID=A0A7X9S282_9BACT|nr:hypothetical protein [Flammeovirga aprica]NME72969.1 hypothetical protein [Flammeovirga aprica JL-4]